MLSLLSLLSYDYDIFVNYAMLSFSSHFQIHSDLDDGKGNLKYSLKGRGANQDPFHVFVVDERTGLIRVTQLLDREFISLYNVSETKTVIFHHDFSAFRINSLHKYL